MATLVIPNTCQIAVEATCSGQPVFNVLHFYGGASTFFNGGQVLDSFKTAWEKTGGPHKTKASNVTMVGYKFTDLSSATGATAYLGSTTAGGAGAGISTMAASALIRLTGGTRSRSGSGRLYHGPLRELEINTDGRTIETAAALALTTAYNTFKNDMAAAGLTWVVASRKNSTQAEVRSVQVSSIIATQRRRLR